ncbi:helix-turn-helix domain-containing protein [Hyphomicrobium sp.]|uniref:helix-turn-helix domain-containing protein n=1 Tax=Hyphomicrobium sp. TaxID=82 RepID=UPI002E304819|nr:helix-turn-helix domain-containing protein [Hyphomicrobium sp.]HEX2842276.1 helix-turn-helix domain-containing protein [Hyphomicrobium sp.]
MSDSLVTVEQAAELLNLHPKTVLRYIRDGRLPATRIGKSYRIARANLDAFAGVANGRSETAGDVRTTCIVDIPEVSVDRAERMATFLHAAAMTGNADTPPLHLEAAFDPLTKAMKVVVIGIPSDVAKLLEMLEVQLRARP